MTNEFKNQIVSELKSRLDNDSQNKLATKLDISSTNMSHILNGKWEKISDDYWRKLANALNLNTEWQLFGSVSLSTIQNLCEDAQTNHRFLAGYGATGAGKTTALRNYSTKKANVGYVLCDVLMNQNQFLTEILQSFGLTAEGTKISKIQKLANHLNRVESPLLILDDFGKVSDSIYQLLQLIYDRTEGSAGIVIFGVEYLKDYLDKMRNKNKLGFRELYRRIAYWQVIGNISDKEVKYIANQYGIDGKQELHFVKNNVTCFGTLKNLVLNAIRAAKGEKITLEILQSLNLSN
jgi:DNA transposition AAA+ family ATPase